jgi:hypothetical protein
MKRTLKPLFGMALIGLLLLIAAVASGCGASAVAEPQPPDSVQKSTVAGQPSLVYLTSDAVNKVGIQTVAVKIASSTGTTQELVVPYSSILYDPNGQAWVFTNPQALQFVRAAVTIDQIQGDYAYLSKGPAVGTLVVTVGAEELSGTEYGVGHE